MKKMLLSFLLVFMVVGAKAQFESGDKYVGASLSGLNLSYSKSENFRLGLDINAGYFVSDGVLFKGNIGYDHTEGIDNLNIGAGARYFLWDNGIFVGFGLQYQHYTSFDNDFVVPLEVGYAYYLNHFLTIEPSAYYKMSLNDFSNDSKIGLSLGLGYYF